MNRELTPAMQQYVDMKKQYADCLLLFRMGDFYETFFEDAKVAAKVLDIVLTSKNKNSENPIPMAGIPFHSVEKYIDKLVKHGYKIAIAEQVSDPVPGKIVERKVQSIVTPGTYLGEEQKQFSYICAITSSDHTNGTHYHCSWGDVSIGSFQTQSFESLDSLLQVLLRLQPKEIVLDYNFPDLQDVQARIQQYLRCMMSVYNIPLNAEQYVCDLCHVQTINSYGKALLSGRLEAFALLLHYLSYTQNSSALFVSGVRFANDDGQMLLDDTTIKNLEILASSYEGEERYSLVGVLDTTQTTGGSRLLRHILTHPSYDPQVLDKRLGYISFMLDRRDVTEQIHTLLRNCVDIPRIVSRLLYRKFLPMDLVKLRTSLALFFGGNVSSSLKSSLQEYFRMLGLEEATLDAMRNLYNHLDQLLKDDEEVNNSMNYIREGYSQKIDELSQVAFRSDEKLLAYQQEVVQQAGVSGVRIKFIKNQGYFLEVSNRDIETLESATDSDDTKFSFQRRQTLKGVQRYATPYLESLQQDIVDAEEALVAEEQLLLEKTKDKLAGKYSTIMAFADAVSMLDVYSSHVLSIAQYRLTKPVFVRDGALRIMAGRHLVIEKFLPIDEQFIPNNLAMDPESYVHIITGPNMGGKSTFLRQNALVVLMAHCGFYVPAKQVELPYMDGLFARVGSGDVIAKNQSTFMTEMIEVANILHNASSKSFVIFDELGRGTSTYDGLALTQAILQYIAKKVQSKTLIATHYHELIQLEGQLPGVQNFSVSVYETEKEVVFMKKIVKGGASKSYGIDVAKLAGIPETIIAQSQAFLQQLEQDPKHRIDTPLLQQTEPVMQDDPKFSKIKKILQSYDINNITPLQALQLLAKIKGEM